MNDFEKQVKEVAMLYFTDGVSEKNIQEKAASLLKLAKKELGVDKLQKKIDEFDANLNALYNDYTCDGLVEEAAGVSATLKMWNDIFDK